MKAIIICGLPASGKTTVAEILSKKLMVPCMGGSDFLREIAMEYGYHPKGIDWWDTKEGIEFLRVRDKNQEIDKRADEKVKEKVKAGNVIITSTTAPWIAQDGLKVWLGSSPKVRAQRMSKRDKTDIKEAARVVELRVKENYDLYNKLYGIRLGEDLSPFNMIVETDDRTPEQVAEIIIKKVKEKSE